MLAHRSIAIAAVLAALLGACSKEEPAPKSTSAAQSKAPAAPAAPATAAPASSPNPPSAAASLTFWEAQAQTPRQIGSYDAGLGRLIARPGQAGFLVAGPYTPLPPARYVVAFEVEAEGTTESPGVVDVNEFTAAQPSHVLGSKPIEGKAGPQTIEVEFEAATAGAAYEFRVISNGKGRLIYKKSSLSRK